MSRKRIVCFILLLSLLFTTGCWDSTEVNDLAFELAWGIDKAKNKALLISAQVIIPSKITGGKSGGGSDRGGGQGKPYFVVTGIGKDSLDAVQQMQTKLSRQVFRGHRRVIVIGEPLARQGIKDVLDTYSRDPNLKLRTDLFVIKGGTAKDFLKVSYPLENIPGLGAVKEYNQMGSLKEMGFLNFLISATSEGSCPTLPVIAIDNKHASQEGEEQENQSNENGFHIAGTGIFDKNLKLIGFLNSDESRALRWVTGNLKKLTITAVVPQEKGYVSLDVIKMGNKIKPIIQENKIKILVTLTGQGYIRENNTVLDLTETKNIDLIQKALDKHVEKSVLRTITMVQKKYGTDIFGFSDTIHRRYQNQWKLLKKNWDKEFPEAEISVQANLTVRQIGVTGPSLQLDEKSIEK